MLCLNVAWRMAEAVGRTPLMWVPILWARLPAFPSFFFFLSPVSFSFAFFSLSEQTNRPMDRAQGGKGGVILSF